MGFLAAAKSLAAAGFHVFPLIPGSKLPAIEGFPDFATRDVKQIEAWWVCPVMGWEQPYNIGISTTRFGDNEALSVIDVDTKNGRKGNESLLQLELEGCDLPETYEQNTPTGGKHIVYRCPHPVKQGAGVLGPGLDTRGRGGFIVGAGSEVEAGVYTIGGSADIAPAPQWLIERCGRAVSSRAPARLLDPASGGGAKVDRDRAERRAVDYLAREAPLSEPGEHNEIAYRVACRLKDMGVVEQDCGELLTLHWIPRCDGAAWSDEALAEVISNAYRYGQEPIGAAAPEMQFEPVAQGEIVEAEEDIRPEFVEMNEDHAFVIAEDGHFILHDPKDGTKPRHWELSTFHLKHAAWKMTTAGGKTEQVSKSWLSSPERREYFRVCFRPGLSVPPKVLNLWRGFSVEPQAPGETATVEAQASLAAFLEHARENVCNGDEAQFRWLIGYFAHLVQRPWEKPLTALVFKGSKGVGKNALIERVAALIDDNFLLASRPRYLVGNFNGHLENLLLLALDEAFWSGDKHAEGVLKDLITGKWQIIERKNQEPYRVENCLRVVVIGNENWLVPASYDERRFAAFHVGEGRKQDLAFFTAMREGMERGGYRLLLRHLLDYDLAGIDINQAPVTAELLEQKLSSLETFHQWWLDSLTEGTLIASDFEGWPERIEKARFRAAFARYRRERNISSRGDSANMIGKLLHQVLPSVDPAKKLRRPLEEGGELVNGYVLPALAEARRQFERFVGHEISWT